MPRRPEETTKSQKTFFFTDFVKPKTLVVLMGPTGVGKTDFSIALAQKIGSPIISCDSRQIYKELNIGVARPTPEQLNAVPHHFIASHSIQDYYSVGSYEREALALIDDLFVQHDTLLMVGGSGLYIDAVCFGIDDVPAVDEELRAQLTKRMATEGVDLLSVELKALDPDYYSEVDVKNPARVLRALEVCLTAGEPFSKIRQNSPKFRNFEIRFVVLNRDRAELYDRINLRVDQMMEQGLLEEAKSMHQYKHLNALKTVGYRELFDYFENKCTLDEAVELIKRNSRRYAKRQLTWFGRYEGAEWLEATASTAVDEIMNIVK